MLKIQKTKRIPNLHTSGSGNLKKVQATTRKAVKASFQAITLSHVGRCGACLKSLGVGAPDLFFLNS